MISFKKDFFKDLFNKNPQDLTKLADETLGSLSEEPEETTETKAETSKPLPLPKGNDRNFEKLLKRLKSGKKQRYDSPILEDYYSELNKEEGRLHKGKMVDFSDPKSERYYLDGDMGERATGDMPNAKTSGWTGLFTKRQMEEAGEPTGGKGVQTADIPSTAIARIRYNPETRNLYVTFKGGEGKEYLYPNVGEDVVRKFLNAPSKGRFTNKRITPYAVSKEEALAIRARDKGR